MKEGMICCVSLSNLSPSLGLMFGIQPTHRLRGDLAMEGGIPNPGGAQAGGMQLPTDPCGGQNRDPRHSSPAGQRGTG